MSKVCIACGLEVENPRKSPEEAEDCPNCGEPDGAVPKKDDEQNENKDAEEPEE